MSVTTLRLPLASLDLAPENARHGQEHEAEALATLAASITAVGLLDPLKAYQDGDTYRVWDGGRRLAALRQMATLPDHLADGVPVIVTTAGAAELASLATFIREDMHPSRSSSHGTPSLTRATART
jgi:ParB-like chromosome segregation protein Spo0J